jgi:ferric-dicitrate binding protein FerR (iron transport regulator)
VALARADEDPPGRAARLNYLGGSVSFRSGSVDEWTDASRNYPLTTGDHLWVDRGARAELHLGGSVVRLGPETAFSFLNLDDQTAQLRLSEGALSVRVTHLEPDEVLEVDTPNAAVTLLRPGLYRIDVRSDAGQTIVSGRHGAAEVQSGGSVFPVREGESAYVSGIDDPSYDVREARDRDDWEDWCSERDRRQVRSASCRYVSKEMVGYSDLDELGLD